MTDLVRSELLKVRTVRSWWGYLAVIVLLAGLVAAGEIGSAAAVDRDTVEFQLRLVDGIGVAGLIALVLGITIVSGEFRHGTVTPTLLSEPRRPRVVASKAVASLLLALLFALLAFAAVVAVSVVWYALVGADLRVGDGDLWLRVLQHVVLAVLWVLMGVAIGVLVQGQVAALVGTLVWLFLVETLLIGLFSLLDVEGLRGYLPFQALDALDGAAGDDLLPYGRGLAVAVAWIALLGAAGTERLRRRDVT